MPEFDLDAALVSPLVPEEYAHCIHGTWEEVDGKVNVEGWVGLINLNLTELPIRFGTVSRFFGCHHNQLTSLAGAPTSVGGGFSCDNNQLTSLAGAPTYVGGDFYCYENQLTSLAGAPTTLGGDFSCDEGVPGEAEYRRRLNRARI